MSAVDFFLVIVCIVAGVLMTFLLVVGVMELTYRMQTKHMREFTAAAKKAREEGRLL